MIKRELSEALHAAEERFQAWAAMQSEVTRGKGFETESPVLDEVLAVISAINSRQYAGDVGPGSVSEALLDLDSSPQERLQRISDRMIPLMRDGMNDIARATIAGCDDAMAPKGVLKSNQWLVADERGWALRQADATGDQAGSWIVRPLGPELIGFSLWTKADAEEMAAQWNRETGGAVPLQAIHERDALAALKASMLHMMQSLERLERPDPSAEAAAEDPVVEGDKPDDSPAP
mgnify:CR=1 FL=1